MASITKSVRGGNDATDAPRDDGLPRVHADRPPHGEDGRSCANPRIRTTAIQPIL